MSQIAEASKSKPSLSYYAIQLSRARKLHHKCLCESSTRQTDKTDNTYVDGEVAVTMVGDVNNDDLVDITDMAMVAYAYDSKLGDPRWQLNLDINNDNIIDITDVAMVVYHYGDVEP